MRDFQEQLFHRTPLVAASENLKAEAVVRSCSVKKVFLEILLNSHVPESPFHSLRPVTFVAIQPFYLESTFDFLKRLLRQKQIFANYRDHAKILVVFK